MQIVNEERSTNQGEIYQPRKDLPTKEREDLADDLHFSWKYKSSTRKDPPTKQRKSTSTREWSLPVRFGAGSDWGRFRPRNWKQKIPQGAKRRNCLFPTIRPKPARFRVLLGCGNDMKLRSKSYLRAFTVLKSGVFARFRASNGRGRGNSRIWPGVKLQLQGLAWTLAQLQA